MRRLNVNQASKLLNDNDQAYIAHYELGKSKIHDGCGDELAEITQVVFTRLLEANKIVYFAESPLLWSKGYFHAPRVRARKI